MTVWGSVTPAKRHPPLRHVPVEAGLPRWLFTNHPLALAMLGLSVLLATVLFVDQPLYSLGQSLAPEEQRFFHFVTVIGNAAWKILLAGALIAIFRLAARHASRPRNAILYRHGAALAGFVLVCVLTSGFAVNVVKHLIGRARPGTDSLFALDPMRHTANWASFPSGHATTVFALAVALCCLFPRLRLAFLAVAVWVALSRVMIGAHWTSDVIAGAALGSATALMVRRWYAMRGWVFAWRSGAFRARHNRLGQAIGHDLRRVASLNAPRAARALTRSYPQNPVGPRTEYSRNQETTGQT